MYRNIFTQDILPKFIEKMGEKKVNEFLNKTPFVYDDNDEIKHFFMCKQAVIIPLEYIKRTIDKNWDWSYGGLSSNPNITPEFIEKHIDKNWYWGAYGLSSNPNITPEFIEKHIDKNWHWGAYGLSSNPIITQQFVKDHIDKKWDFGIDGLSKNKDISVDFVLKYIDKNWDISILFKLSYPWKFKKISIDFKRELCATAYSEQFPMGKADREEVRKFFTTL